jgi:hypothetical protein
MADAFLVSIDLPKIQDHFAATDRLWSFAEIESWLADLGFKRSGANWIVVNTSLDALDGSEFRIVRPI